MQKRTQYNKKNSAFDTQKDSEQVSTYKNQNVIFKIHSPKGQQKYNGKTFPAKFSINICNQPTQLATGLYNRQSVDSRQYISPRKNEEGVKSDRSKPNFDLDQYEKQIKLVLQDKKKCDNLILQLEQTCQQYQRQIMILNESIKQKEFRISQLQKECLKKQKNQLQIRQALLQKQLQIKQLNRKIKLLETQLKKLKNNKIQNQKDIYLQNKNLQAKIYELQCVISEKQVTIKNLSNFNNQICKKMLDEHLYSSTSHVKQMQKWLKLMSKKYEDGNKQKINSKDANIIKQNSLISQLLTKNQIISNKLYQLQKNNNKLSIDIGKMIKENDHLFKINSQLNQMISELEAALQQKQTQKDTQETFYRRNLGSNFIQQQYGIIYQGTVKVKMDCLLIQKDKRINQLQNQLQDSKKQNTMLRTKLYQLDCQQQFNQTIKSSNLNFKRVRSAGSFYRERIQSEFNNTQQQPQKSQNQLNKILSQCNNLTKTLGSFMESQRTERFTCKEDYKNYHNLHKFNQTQQNNTKQMMTLQKNAYNNIKANNKRTCSNLQQTRWNNFRQQKAASTNSQSQFLNNLYYPNSQRLYYAKR